MSKKSFTVVIELEMVGDPSDKDTVKEAVYQYLLNMIDDESLSFEVK
jgi:hypothetical protein